MRSLRDRNLAEEVASIQKEIQGVSVDDTFVKNDSDDNVTKDSECVGEGDVFLSNTGSRFDLLIHSPDDTGEAQHKRVVRKATRNTSGHVNGVSGNVGRCQGSLLQCKKRLVPQPFSYLLVCDFEATCDSSCTSYPHEIIEFPVVCVNTANLRVVAEFHSYVRPKKNPRLTQFCTSLTGITQAHVDGAPTLPEVLERFDLWLREVVYPLCREWAEEHTEGLSNCLRARQKYFVYDEERNPTWVDCEKMICMVTDGPWDMRKFMYECSVLRDGYRFPPLFYRWINLRHCFAQHFHIRPRKLTDMLKKLDLNFHGRQHSGIDDSRNIARILIELLKRGYRVHQVSTIEYIGTSADLTTTMTEQLEEFGENDMRTTSQRKGKARSGCETVTVAKRNNRRR